MMKLGSCLTYVRLSALAALALFRLSSPAVAADVRQYGAFTVLHEKVADTANCKLIIEQTAAGKFFRFSMAKYVYLNLAMIYATDLDELRGREAFLEINQQKIVRLHGGSAKLAGPVLSMHPEKEADRLMQWLLKRAAQDARQIEVVAGDFRWPIPVEGFQQAVNDYVGCREG